MPRLFGMSREDREFLKLRKMTPMERAEYRERERVFHRRRARLIGCILGVIYLTLVVASIRGALS